MPLHVLNNTVWFPPVEDALEDGLLAIGGDVSAERLLLAYQKGIFPWYSDDTPLWWSPDPRFVLFPDKLRVSKSMQALIRKKTFRFSVNEAFPQVIKNCKELQRPGQEGTWITDELEASVNQLHLMGYAHSAEAWLEDELVGGLYGIKMGRLFFGESMFSKASNASKFAFLLFVQQLRKENIHLIDCQVYTDHLASLGAEMIPRTAFLQALQDHGAELR